MDKCQYIGASTRGPCCENPSLEGRSYCEEHLWLVYQKGTHLARRKKDLARVDSIREWETLFDEAVQELEAEGSI